MKFEYFIWIIIFIAFVGFTIFRRMRPSSKTGRNRSDNQGSGWKEKLDNFMSQVQQMAGDEDKLKYREQKWKDLSPKTIEPAVEKPLIPEQKPDLQKSIAERTETTAPEKAILPIYFDTSIPDLRKAVIWSEILAPPLALRDKRLK